EPDPEKRAAARREGTNGGLTFSAETPHDGANRRIDGTSIFDPVLCELSYRWFCPSGGQVLDPFSGGSVRGIVAGCLGYKYWGCDLRAEQVEENEKQAKKIQPAVRPQWFTGDALECVQDAPLADFIFSCPPYGDLEVYSDDPNDLSTMAPPD